MIWSGLLFIALVIFFFNYKLLSLIQEKEFTKMYEEKMVEGRMIIFISS